jgi:hypothetical protein
MLSRVAGELMSLVSTSVAPTRAAISSNEHCPDRSGSTGPGSVTTAAMSARRFAASWRQSRPMTSKLTQTTRKRVILGRGSGDGYSDRR